MTPGERLDVLLGVGSGLSPRWYLLAAVPLLLGLAVRAGLRGVANRIEANARMGDDE